MLLSLLFIIMAYLVGSLNSAVLVCKAMKLRDPRTEGSGNPGATNVLRIGGKQAAMIVLLGDILKGFLPIILASAVHVSGTALAFVGLSAVIGHMYPVFFQFKGGKGIATAFGVLLALSFWIAFIATAVWVTVVWMTKYVSLASLSAVVASLVLILFAHTAYFLPLFVLTALVIFRHKDNIQRLRTGTENKTTLL